MHVTSNSASVTPDTADGRTTPGSLPLYIAAFLVTLSSLLSMGLLLDEDPGFISLTMALTGIGFVVSFLIRRQAINAYSVELPAAAVCVMLAIAATTDQGIPFLSPLGLEGDRAKTLAVVLTWISVFRSFTLITDGSVLFTCVLSIAIMGLVGTMNSNPLLTRYYALFVAAAAFMMVHESFLSARRRQSSARKPRQSRLFLSQVQFALACALGALILAVPVAAPLQALGSLLAFTPPTQGNLAQQKSNADAQRINIVEQPAISVGTGPVSLSDQPVMRIKATQGSYWRGTTFNDYTGRGWSSTLEQTRTALPDASGRTGDDIFSDPLPGQGRQTFTLEPNPLTGVGPRSYELQQSIRYVGNGIFQDIYAAPEVRSLRMAEDRAQLDEAGGIHLFRPVQHFDYAVTSRVPYTNPELLRAAGEDYPSVIRATFLGPYRSNPSSIARLRQTAEGIIRGKRSPYDRVIALKQWIEQECKYNIGAPAYPVDVDVTEHFLFTAKQGYCDSFATSLAVLCRAVGIPSRIASGFAPGTYEAESQEYVVAEKDKHLWTEVYFPNVGWVTFDATEGAEDISDRGAQQKNKKSQSLLGMLLSRGILPPLALILMLAMLAYVFKVEVWDRHRPRRLRLEHLGLPAANLDVIDVYDSACKSLARLGRPRLACVTPAEYLTELTRVLHGHPEAVRALEALTDLVIRARYGAAALAESDAVEARTQLAALRSAIRPVKGSALTSPMPSAEPA